MVKEGNIVVKRIVWMAMEGVYCCDCQTFESLFVWVLRSKNDNPPPPFAFGSVLFVSSCCREDAMTNHSLTADSADMGRPSILLNFDEEL